MAEALSVSSGVKFSLNRNYSYNGVQTTQKSRNARANIKPKF